MTHILRVTRTFPDGHVDQWETNSAGSATDAHSNLAARWKAAGATYERNKTALTLTKSYDADRGGPFIEVVAHVEDRSC